MAEVDALEQVPFHLAWVLRGLWESSADDAPLRDRASGLYYRAAGWQALDHRGEFYQVAGPLSLSWPSQGHPPLFLNLVYLAQRGAQLGAVLLTPGDGVLSGQFQAALHQLGRGPHSAAAQDRLIRPGAKSVGPLPGEGSTERRPAGSRFPGLA